MAKITVVRYCCDRCGMVSDHKFPNPIPRVSVTFVKEDEWHSESIVWKDLCESCRKESDRLFEEIYAGVRNARYAQVGDT